MYPILKPLKAWWLNRQWKKEYGTDSPAWAKKDLMSMYEIIQDPEFISWYQKLPEDKRKLTDEKVNFMCGQIDRYIIALDNELIKRGQKPDTIDL